MADRCIDCGNGFKGPADVWLEVAGYARPRERRGEKSGSSLVDRHTTGRAICSGCATRRIQGVSQGQGAIDMDLAGEGPRTDGPTHWGERSAAAEDQLRRRS